MKWHILCILFALIPIISFAQGLIEPGYYIDLKGQKHKGQFLFKKVEQEYPSFFLFKKDAKSLVDTLHVEQIAELEVLDFHYLRTEAKMYDTEATTTISEPNFKIVSLLLKTEERGNASLFSYLLDGKITFFLSVADEQPEQLIYQEFLRQDNRTSTNTRFRYQLEQKLTCTTGSFNEIRYTKEALTKTVSEYNSCTGNASEVYSGFPGLSSRYLNIGLSAGASAYFIESYQTVLNNEMVHYSDVYLPQFGFELEYLIPSLTNRFSVFLNGDYQQFEGEKKIYAQGSSQTATLSYQAITTTAGIRAYFKLNDRTRVFADLGYGKDFEVGKGISISYSVSRDFDEPKLSGHLTGGLGLVLLNRYVIEAHFKHLSTSISDSRSNQRVVQSLFTLNLKYLLKSYYK